MMSGCWFIILNNKLVFQIQSLQIFYEWSVICGQFWLFFMFSFVPWSKLIILLFYYVVMLLSSFSITRPLLVSKTYVSIESIDYILLSSFELKIISLISLVKILWFSLLNLCCIFNFNLLLFLMNCYDLF